MKTQGVFMLLLSNSVLHQLCLPATLWLGNGTYFHWTCVHRPAGVLKENVPRRRGQPFHFDLWLCLTVQNWILDFGRPIVMVRRQKATIWNLCVSEQFMRVNRSNMFLYHMYVIDHPSSGVVSTKQAQRWRLLPHGLQCHHTVFNAQGKSLQRQLYSFLSKSHFLFSWNASVEETFVNIRHLQPPNNTMVFLFVCVLRCLALHEPQEKKTLLNLQKTISGGTSATDPTLDGCHSK